MKNDKNQYDKLTVYYANELARKYSRFTLEEQKALHLIFSQINPYDKNPTVFKLNKFDFFKKLELNSTDRYNRYRKLIRGLIDKSFFEVKDEHGGERVGVVIYDSYWRSKESFFEVSLNPNFMPYLEQLVRDYTKLQLDEVLQLKSKYALTFYKFLCSWTNEKKKQNQRYLTTKDLKELLGLTENDYSYENKFHRKLFENKTIDIALAEINEKTNFVINYKKNKKNNRVLNYEFIWKKK